MLQYYHARIVSGIYDLQSSKEIQNALYIRELAKFVCSMISQAVNSFVALNGESYPYTSDLTDWAAKEIEIFALCFNKYVESISDISGGVSTAVDALQIAMSYCSLLENQRMFLRPTLIDHVRPCIEDVLRLHIDHLSNVISIFTSTDTWALGRYYVSGILTGWSYAIIDQQPEYFFLTNSGRKFVTLFQSVADDMSPLIALQMESSVLKAITDLLTAYIVILESALSGDTDVIEKHGFRINSPESPTQGFFILANISTLVQFSTCIIRNLFDGIHHLDFEIDNYLTFVQDVYGRLKACFLGQFISNIFSQMSIMNLVQNFALAGRMILEFELFLELKKLQKLAEEDCIDMNWLISLLREAMDTAFEWISSRCEKMTINSENLAGRRNDFMQFILDAQFLVEIARSGGYLSDNVINVSTNIISRLEESFISAGLSPLRDMNDGEWPANAATRALKKLQELHEKENTTTSTQDSLPYVS
ncbi:hypothetical protein DH2020_024757 [Rehmannia glutinosa]|uniref:Uncharacterized protein n=1 Tax=Rehmannia glutinosa TaxID=99300 RepID=A0ABR0W419_REHGL